MSKINEIYQEINTLQQLLDNEPEYSKIRKLKIQAEIDELEDEKKHLGFKQDHSSIVQVNSKIKKLKHKTEIDYEKFFKSKIEKYQAEVLDIIVNYYSDGVTIDDISGDIDDEILDDWFGLSDFGKSTGYLFIQQILDEYNWQYINPINGVSFKAVTFNELKDKIISANEVFLKFNQDLADKPKQRDLMICQSIIDNNLTRLSDYSADDKIIFTNLKIHADKFSNNQIVKLCNIIFNKSNIDGCSKDFRYILEINNVDEDFLVNTCRIIIENKLNYLKSNLNEIGGVICDLNVYANEFSESQIILLCEIIKKVPFYSYSADFFKYFKSQSQ